MNTNPTCKNTTRQRRSFLAQQELRPPVGLCHLFLYRINNNQQQMSSNRQVQRRQRSKLRQGAATDNERPMGRAVGTETGWFDNFPMVKTIG